MSNADENTRRIMAYNNSLTPEERRKRAVENGKRSGEARKKRKTWRESVQMVMAGALDLGGMTDDELRRVMERERPDEDTITIDEADYVVVDS